jgi:hypothetical protein
LASFQASIAQPFKLAVPVGWVELCETQRDQLNPYCYWILRLNPTY